MTPDALTTALLVIAALGAGTVDAIAGGGGLITVPALFAAGLPPHVALATNKGQSVWGSGAAMLTFWRHGRLDLRQARLTFPLAFAGALARRRGGARGVTEALRPIAIVLLVVAVIVLLVKKPRATDRRARRHRLAIAGGSRSASARTTASSAPAPARS